MCVYACHQMWGMPSYIIIIIIVVKQTDDTKFIMIIFLYYSLQLSEVECVL